jgi:hypothetical protein
MCAGGTVAIRKVSIQYGAVHFLVGQRYLFNLKISALDLRSIVGVGHYREAVMNIRFGFFIIYFCETRYSIMYRAPVLSEEERIYC